jgi:hypothetical protein
LLQRFSVCRSSPYWPNNPLRRLPLLAGAAKVEQQVEQLVEAQELQPLGRSGTPQDEASSNLSRFPVSAINGILSAK